MRTFTCFSSTFLVLLLLASVCFAAPPNVPTPEIFAPALSQALNYELASTADILAEAKPLAVQRDIEAVWRSFNSTRQIPLHLHGNKPDRHELNSAVGTAPCCAITRAFADVLKPPEIVLRV